MTAQDESSKSLTKDGKGQLKAGMRELKEQVEVVLRACENEMRELQETQQPLRAQLKELEQVLVWIIGRSTV